MLPDLHRPHRSKSSDDSLIPMINVVFLLLIFFMVAGQIKTTANPAVLLPYSALGEAAEEQPYRIEIDHNNQLTLNGEALELEALDQRLGDLEASRIRIALLADKRLTARDLDEVLSVIRSHGIAKINLFSDSQELQ